MKTNYQIDHKEGSVPVKRWTRGVAVEAEALRQLSNIAKLPFIHKWVAAMPDVHWGMGATIGSVIPTKGAIIPAAVGVDLGCGMIATRTSLRASDLPDSLAKIRNDIERAVPHGRSKSRGRKRDKGSWWEVPEVVGQRWRSLRPGFEAIVDKHPKIAKSNHVHHLGTLGTGNHFVELCLDESDQLWVMLHSGSRGVGNRIGMYFIEKAKEDMLRLGIALPDHNLAYFSEGASYFEDYVQAVGWAQDFARVNRILMMEATLHALSMSKELPPFRVDKEAVNCHHNYVNRELHYGEQVWVTRKGAVSAKSGERGIIPGSMGTRSYIVRGKGNPESFCSCSHGAGRAMSRTAARERFTLEDHAKATAGVECRKDKNVLDETPGAYKPIEAVMKAQDDLVEIEHTLRQVVCVKG